MSLATAIFACFFFFFSGQAMFCSGAWTDAIHIPSNDSKTNINEANMLDLDLESGQGAHFLWVSWFWGDMTLGVHLLCSHCWGLFETISFKLSTTHDLVAVIFLTVKYFIRSGLKCLSLVWICQNFTFFRNVNSKLTWMTCH